jgi:hypothetical protein
VLFPFRLALQELQKWLKVALGYGKPKFGSPDSQASNRIITFRLRKNSLCCGDVHHGR